MSDFKTWFDQETWNKTVIEGVNNLCQRVGSYVLSYEHPDCRHTSNLVDRFMNRLTRYLYAGRGLHGHQSKSEYRLRG